MKLCMLSPYYRTLFYKRLKIIPFFLVLLSVFHFWNGTATSPFCPGQEGPAYPHCLHPPQSPPKPPGAPPPKAPTSLPFSNAGIWHMRLGQLVKKKKKGDEGSAGRMRAVRIGLVDQGVSNGVSASF